MKNLRGIVVDVYNDHVIVLTPDADVLEVATNGQKFEIGQEILFYEKEQEKEKPKWSRVVRYTSALVASALVFVINPVPLTAPVKKPHDVAFKSKWSNAGGVYVDPTNVDGIPPAYAYTGGNQNKTEPVRRETNKCNDEPTKDYKLPVESPPVKRPVKRPVKPSESPPSNKPTNQPEKKTEIKRREPRQQQPLNGILQPVQEIAEIPVQTIQQPVQALTKPVVGLNILSDNEPSSEPSNHDKKWILIKFVNKDKKWVLIKFVNRCNNMFHFVDFSGIMEVPTNKEGLNGRIEDGSTNP